MSIVNISDIVKYGVFTNFLEQLLAGGDGGLELGTNIVGYSEYTDDNKWETRYKNGKQGTLMGNGKKQQW